MVYRGRPSPNCERCRARRLKCDQATPSCSQCIRVGVVCVGYRDLKSLVIRNESTEVARKAQLKRAKELDRDPKSSACRSRSAPTAGLLVPLVQQPSIPMREHAICFAQQSYLDTWLWPSTLDLDIADNAAASSSVTALGLAILANTKLSPPLMMAAREEYTAALRSTNIALQDPLLSKSDLTLMAVMFLGMFEVVTCTGLNSILQWRKHIDGAVKLLEWRGAEQLRSRRGLHLFRQMRAQILIHNIFGESPTSPVLRQLSQQACALEDGLSRFGDHLANINIQLTKLCADMKQGTMTDPRAIIRAALALDAELASWAVGMPSSLMYTKFFTTGRWGTTTTYGPYTSHYYVYQDLFASNLWGNWRGARFVIHEIIMQHLDYLQKEQHARNLADNSCNHVKVARHSEIILRDLTADICASVPYHFAVANEWTAADGISRENKVLAAGYSLLWPLFLVACCRFSTPDLKRWIILSLDKIGHEMGISQALAITQLLLRGMGPRTWNQPESEVADVLTASEADPDILSGSIIRQENNAELDKPRIIRWDTGTGL
ncbi:Fungal Zn2-Cys6 binuclear cluster domain-containing protein isoform 2 [Cladophialophora immunda]|nr:Fungal Zn2-Cys6 binuclear cluster domain-containing protein isoform 2 [Cladophialophora immunda]